MKEETECESRSVHRMITHEQSISSRDYTRVCELIYREAGIRLGPEKQTMLEGRLNRRLKVLDLETYGARG